MSEWAPAGSEADAARLRQAEPRFGVRRAPDVVLHATGVRHPRAGFVSAPTSRESFTAYTDLTHVVLGRRSLRIGTRRQSLLLRRSQLERAEDAPALVEALRGRVAGLPDGAARIARMDALDVRLDERPRPWVSRGLALVCILAWCLQLWSPNVAAIGIFNADLVRSGEVWRLLTANLLHGSPLHLLLNALGLAVLGSLVESVLGRRGIVFIAGLSALGAMLGSMLAGYEHALGASGIVAGLVGAILWLEIKVPEHIPAPWRLPRELIVGALVADSLLLAFVPGIAHWAHAGGLLAGIGATALVLPSLSDSRRSPGWLFAADGALAGAAAAAVLMLLWGALAPGDVATRMRADRLLSLEGIRPEVLNNEAWAIAVTPDPGPDLLEIAQRLAEAAVDRTERADPNLLDTLAEVYFQLGESERALQTIDEAIALSPEEPYFGEQRRRFIGERDPSDRPAPPPEAVPPLRVPSPPEDPGLRV